jgi:hypothetical protein
MLKNFFVQNGIPFTKVLHLETTVFIEHLFAYEVLQPAEKEFEIVKMSELPECEPLSLLKTFSNDGHCYVCPRHWVQNFVNNSSLEFL